MEKRISAYFKHIVLDEVKAYRRQGWELVSLERRKPEGWTAIIRKGAV